MWLAAWCALKRQFEKDRWNRFSLHKTWPKSNEWMLTQMRRGELLDSVPLVTWSTQEFVPSRKSLSITDNSCRKISQHSKFVKCAFSTGWFCFIWIRKIQILSWFEKIADEVKFAYFSCGKSPVNSDLIQSFFLEKPWFYWFLGLMSQWSFTLIQAQICNLQVHAFH